MFKNFFFFIKGFRTHLINYPTSLLLNNNWCFGFSLGIFLVLQIVTGLFLAAQYVSYSELSFENLEYIMRSINHGWFIRYLHSNGAAFFFILLYLHFFKAIFYKSYSRPRQLVWIVGVAILLVSILTAFTGYVLPWGQMSFWAATVITNLVTAIPIVGSKIIIWIWGGFAVGNGTLKKFFMIHFLLPFFLVILVVLHLVFLHESKSNNSLSIANIHDSMLRFYPYFIIKDLVVFITTLLFYCITVFFFPNIMGHPDNFIRANPLVTPNHIVPEWYFLTFYAILRSIPDKNYGVLLMGCSIVILFFLPVLDNFSTISYGLFNDIGSWAFSLFFFASISLAWVGSMTATEPYILFSQLFVFFYFLFFIAIILIAYVSGSLTKLCYCFLRVFILFFVNLLAVIYTFFFFLFFLALSFFGNSGDGNKSGDEGGKEGDNNDTSNDKKKSSSSRRSSSKKSKKASLIDGVNTSSSSESKTEKRLVERQSVINKPIIHDVESTEFDRELKGFVRIISQTDKKAGATGEKLETSAEAYFEKSESVVNKKEAIEKLKLTISEYEQRLKEMKLDLKAFQKDLTKPHNTVKRLFNSLGPKATTFIDQYAEFRSEVELFKKTYSNVDFKAMSKYDPEKYSWLKSSSFEKLLLLAREYKKNK